jgi:hypothetical protein
MPPYFRRPDAPRPKRVKKPKPRRHHGTYVNERIGFSCPHCGPLGDLKAAIWHSVQFQYVEEPHV